jgi:cytochrome P450 family 4
MFILSVIILLCFIFWLLKNELRKLQLAWNMSGPKALPLIGNALLFLNKSPIEFIVIVRNLISQHGKFFRLWLGNELLLVMTDQSDVQFVLTSMKMITKSNEYKFLQPWLNLGLLTSTDEKWLKRRKILTPAFHFKILDEFIEVFDEQSTILVDKLRKFDRKGHIDVFPIVALSALDVICGKKKN